jgi:hypothetical protein
MRSIGTRSFSRFRQGHPPGTGLNAISTRDMGMSKNVTASMTYGSGQVGAANGTFSAFVIGDPIECIGSGFSGFFTVDGIDAVNGSYLTLDPAPPSIGPITSTIRTV